MATEEHPSVSHPATKRARIEGPEADRRPFINDSALWFEDGNVIVAAEDTAFRVHRGFLSRHSEPFSGLFAMPQPENAEKDEVHKCPVIRVQDSLHDFKHLLRVLYDGLEAYLKLNEPLQFSTLATIVRLGHKYQVETVLATTLDRMQAVLPITFQVWQANDRDLMCPVYFEDGDAIEAVNLMRTCGRDDMLLAAFYECSRLDVHTLVGGTNRADGTLEVLTTGDLERCLVAREMLEVRSAACIRRMFDCQYSAPLRCTPRGPQVPDCSVALRIAASMAGMGRLLESQARGKLHRACISDHGAGASTGTGRCCARLARPTSRRTTKKFLRELWRDLSEIFDMVIADRPPVNP